MVMISFAKVVLLAQYFMSISHALFVILESYRINRLGKYRSGRPEVFCKKVLQKQSPRGVPRKRCSENMQQIYRRTPMPN